MTEFNVLSNNFSLIGLTEIIPPRELGVHKTMSGARVNEGGKMEGRSRDKREFRLERADALSQTTSRDAHEGQHSPQSVRRSEGCLTFFQVCGGLLLFGLGSTALSLGGR